MRWTVVRKIALGISCVAGVTYGTSAFFIFVLKPYLAPGMSNGWYVSLVLGLGVLWTGFLGWMAALLLVKPLKKLTEALNTAAGGDLRVEIPEYANDDEIGELTTSVRTMLANLRDAIRDVAESVEINSRQADSFNMAIQQAAAGTETIRHVTEAISAGAERQSASTLSTLHSAEHAASAAAEVQQSASQAKQSSERLRATTEESSQAIRSLIDGLTNIAASNRTAIGEINHLKELANEISNISILVQDIAGQTQLLALNATIEAAHAGDQGLGFGVVAGEVRKLSDQTSEAAAHIAKLIERMQREVIGVVQRIEADAQSADKEVRRGEQATSALKEIVEAVTRSAGSVAAIVEGAAAQEANVRETLKETQYVAEAASRIGAGACEAAGVVEEQVAVMQEIAAASDEMRAHGERLRGKIEKFKL